MIPILSALAAAQLAVTPISNRTLQEKHYKKRFSNLIESAESILSREIYFARLLDAAQKAQEAYETKGNFYTQSAARLQILKRAQDRVCDALPELEESFYNLDTISARDSIVGQKFPSLHRFISNQIYGKLTILIDEQCLNIPPASLPLQDAEMTGQPQSINTLSNRYQASIYFDSDTLSEELFLIFDNTETVRETLQKELSR